MKFNLGTIANMKDGGQRPEHASGVWRSPFLGALSPLTVEHTRPKPTAPSFKKPSWIPSMRVNLSLLTYACLS